MRIKGRELILIIVSFAIIGLANSQNIFNNPKSNHGNRFEQLGSLIADPNDFRSASGAPGNAYWQQRADYKIKASLDEENKVLTGSEEVTYFNQSPDVLSYLWLQLDENQHNPKGENNYFDGSNISEPFTVNELKNLDIEQKLEGYGVDIISVTDANGKQLKYTINQTMMRIDLPTVLKPNSKITFNISWKYKIPERMVIGGRGGYEHFDEDGNDLFTITQWYPRLCVYSDYGGWNNKQFTGRGEFSLIFGNFEVWMDVPSDHMIGATGECQNYKEVLSKTEYSRWLKAQKSDEPILVRNREEAINLQRTKPGKENRKTWHYKAENVRDFAWGSSRKFIWDAMAVEVEGKKVMCMSYYPNESFALYNRYSTKVVAHTIKTYSKYTIPYPYPVAISVEASNGMEYPMICFNYGRTDKEGNYSEAIKYGMIGVIIHEVGHNFFPMIINSDERQWSWMDEGLNTFVQFLTEQEFDNNYPSRRGPAHKITEYMKLPASELEPIMTNSENIIQFGPNAYAKPATALNILRETVMGRELFDFAFKEYCKRWAFKHPRPADFFRTMEDASAVDLDWFWRAWFFDIEPVDISLDTVEAFKMVAATQMPDFKDSASISNSLLKPVELPSKRRKGRPVFRDKSFRHISRIRNKNEGMSFAVDRDTTLRDFYYYYDAEKDTFRNRSVNHHYKNPYNNLEVPGKSDLDNLNNSYFYKLKFSNIGGAVSPVIIQWNYSDSTSKVDYISAYIWRKNESEFTKSFGHPKKVQSIVIDPYKETADIDESNQMWTLDSYSDEQTKGVHSRFDIFKIKQLSREESNPMKRANSK